MKLKDLEIAYKKVKGGSFYNSHWSNHVELERYFELWLDEKHPEFFSMMGPDLGEQEKYLVKNGKVSELLSFLESLPKNLQSEVFAKIGELTEKAVNKSEKWKTSEDELDSFQDYFYYPYFESEWKGMSELESEFLKWIKKNRNAFYKEMVQLRRVPNASAMESEIRNREGAQVIVDFLHSLPESLGKSAIKVLRAEAKRIKDS